LRTPLKIATEASARLARLGVLAALIAAPQIAHGQPSAGDRTVAESLFLEARKLMSDGKIPEACAKFEASQRLDPAGGTLLNLAVCHEREGKVASAWGEFRQSLALAKREQREDREKLSQEQITALEKRLPYLQIEVLAAVKVAGLAVRVNGTPFVDAVWGTPVPVDPGEITVEVEAPGYKPWSSKVKLAEGKTEIVKIPKLEAAPAPPVSAAPPPTTTAPPPGPIERRDEATGLRTTTSYVLLGVGALGIGVGGYFGLRALSKKGDSDDNCPQNRCTQAGVDLNNDAKSSARIANLGVGLGLVALGAGAFLLLSGPSTPERSGSSVSLSVLPLHRGGAASLGGSF
jgi:hypothetical protein